MRRLLAEPGAGAIRSKLTLADAGDQWLRSAEVGRNGRPPCEAATLEQYESHLRVHIKPLWGHLKLASLDAFKMQDMRAELLASGISRSMAIKIWTSLKGILNEAMIRGVILGNPAQPIKIGRHRSAEAPVQIPSPHEMRLILEAADRFTMSNHLQVREAWERWRPFLYTAALTGLRASELRGLPWSAVGSDEIRVVQRADRYSKIGPPKSASGYRAIAITAELQDILREWRQKCPVSELDLVFPTISGTVENLPNITNRCWRKAQEAALKTTKYGFHAIRHFRASMVIAAGWTPKEVQVEMGHSSIQVTFDIYGHLFGSGDKRRERARMAQEWLKTA
ncbi:site-specific integrase [Ferrovibrio terrae]|uniref:tyrosine-type recombinase/integrase n=1 Tax=Ferrovibrio terrae TaxID=2594003 RepID=UPI003137BA48